MKISNVIRKLERRGESPDREYIKNQNFALRMLAHLKRMDPNIVQWSGDCIHTGDHYPIDADDNIHFDKKRFFREGEPFPDDEYIWMPTP